VCSTTYSTPCQLSRLHKIYWGRLEFHSWIVCEWRCRRDSTSWVLVRHSSASYSPLWLHKKSLGCLPPFHLRDNNSSVSRSVSSLEAFSCNQTHVGFAALACQPTALLIMWINGSSRTELNYYQNYSIYFMECTWVHKSRLLNSTGG